MPQSEAHSNAILPNVNASKIDDMGTKSLSGDLEQISGRMCRTKTKSTEDEAVLVKCTLNFDVFC